MTKNRQQSFGFFAHQNNKNVNHNGANRNSKPLLSFDFKEWLGKTAIQTVICGIILLVVFSLKAIDTNATNGITNEITYRLNQEFQYKETYKMAVGWGNRLIVKGEKALETLNLSEWGQRQFVMPMEGEIIVNFKGIDDTTGKEINGIIIEGIEGEPVVASDEGVVIEVSSNQSLGHYIIIKHRGEFVSVYKHLQSSQVEVNRKIVKGETIGTSSDKLLFEIWQRKEPIDPLDYIDQQQVSL